MGGAKWYYKSWIFQLLCLEFEGGFGCVNLVQKPRVLYVSRSQILQWVGLGYCKENGSRKLEMTLGKNYILGLVYCKGLKRFLEWVFERN